MFSEQEMKNPTKREAVARFNEAYEAQMAGDYTSAINLYKESIELFPTAEAYTFLGWTYSFQGEYDLAIAECLAAIAVDSTFGNPYNDIGSYLIAKGNFYDCVRWFKLAIQAPRYEARAFPHFNLAMIYEKRGKLLEAAKHYGLALNEQPGYLQAYKALRKLQERLN
ncbi:MAG TPA: tetratricopeptide repeat protein [Pyrinomonadaceae bacterium]|nr:tetratricopeptide repeat protein [Pyrinomonadaceae bacterium]